MIARGAKVSPGDVPILIAYLTDRLGRETPEGGTTPSEQMPAAAASILPRTPLPAHGPIDWTTAARNFPAVGGNQANQRYSTLKTIDRSNVGRLGGAWVVHLEDGRTAGNMEATPVVVDGIMYVSSGMNNVFAIDAAAGTVKWKYASQARVGNMTSRGVVVAEGKVFSGQRDNSLVALDQRTGTLLWKTQLAPAGVGNTSAAPVYHDGLVYIGVAGGESGARGQFGAYDAKTGNEVWKFWTLPGPGEKGHDTWEGDSWAHGGGPVWTQPAIDPELGSIYIAVGNAGPDNDGTERGGDNLFTASIVALDLKTGAYKWHFQEVHHDIWDYDNSAAPALADIVFRGQRRKIVLHAGKTGFVYILDRTNGAPLIGIDERPVPQEPRMKTSRTQPVPIGDAVVPTCPEPGSVSPEFASSCIFGAYWTTPVVMTPGTLGGVSWAPLTFSPDTGLVYVPASIINSAFGLRRERWDPESQRLKGVDEGVGFFRPAGEPRAGTLTAMDPTTNRIVWQKRTTFPLGTGSGLLSTAGGLLFHGESDGNIVAYDIRNGELLWKFQTGAGADAPVATYEINGEQYVAILAGGNSFQLSARGDALWAFKLGGTVPPAPAPPEPPLTQPGAARRGGASPRTPAALASAIAAAPSPVTVSRVSRRMRPGEVVLLTLKAATGPVTVRAFGRDWPAYAVDDRRWRALIGIDLETRPGRYTVDIAAGSGRLAYSLDVGRRVFPTRRLTVDPDLVNPPPEALGRIERETRELGEIWTRSEGRRRWSGPFVRPVPDPANSAFGTRSVYNGEARSPHAGADFLSPEGRPVKAPNAGRVVLAGSLYFTGNTVIIDHGLGLFSLFAHLSEIDVKTGDDVATGDILGKVGATGRVTGPHLHWSVRLNGARVDPLSLLFALGR